MEPAKSTAADLIESYNGCWTSGQTFDQARIESILAVHLDFEGLIAGKRRGAAGFVGGLQRFAEGLRAPIVILQKEICGDEGAVLYDATIPDGTMRFAEFFGIHDGRIASLKLLYDAAEYRALGGR